MIRSRENVVFVEGYNDNVHYIIEPIRFDLGFTRVEMIDDHLSRLLMNQRGHGPDADVLLDARAEFAAADQ